MEMKAAMKEAKRRQKTGAGTKTKQQGGNNQLHFWDSCDR